MADDSLHIIEPFDFHPANSPRGMLYYDLRTLTMDQQINLNDLKRDTIRENEQYLAKHPEVRALVALVTRHVLLHRPRTDLHEFVGAFFARARPDIHDEMDHYIKDREPHIYEGDSAVIVHEESVETSTLTTDQEEDETTLADLPRQMLDEIIQRTYQRLGIDVDYMGESWTDEPTAVVEGVISGLIKTDDAGEEDDTLEYLLDLQARPADKMEIPVIVVTQSSDYISEKTSDIDRTIFETESIPEDSTAKDEQDKEVQVSTEPTETLTEVLPEETSEITEITEESGAKEETETETFETSEQADNAVIEDIP